jgi:fucose 4-O-acetylase-like acetyltransferase
MIICVAINPTSMSSKATFCDWLAIPFTGISGFVLTYYVSKQITKCNNIFRDSLIYIGKNSFYILTFHFLMFKPAALLYAYIYNLDWHVIGCHPVPMQINNNWSWIIYSVTSLALSLILMEILKKLKIE